MKEANWSSPVKHVLVLGVGALGSPLIDHLAKAGVGRISVVDADNLSSANIGRHLLGAEAIGRKKVDAIAQRINSAYPATEVIPHAMTTAEWLKKNSLGDVDAVLDFTGEPDVRVQVEQARLNHPRPLLIGWMEPYVAAAHACVLPAGQRWLPVTSYSPIKPCSTCMPMPNEEGGRKRLAEKCSAQSRTPAAWWSIPLQGQIHLTIDGGVLGTLMFGSLTGTGRSNLRKADMWLVCGIRTPNRLHPRQDVIKAPHGNTSTRSRGTGLVISW